MKQEQTIPFFSVDSPYDIVYRKNRTSTPVKPHTHNALEIYFTLTDLPDVLLNDTVSGVAKGSLIVIPPHCVHQLFNQKLTIYERYIITINSNWLQHVLWNHPDLMAYASFHHMPSILRLPEDILPVLCEKIDLFLAQHPTPSIAGYADFFNLLNLLDQQITGSIKKRTTEHLNISSSQKKVNDIIAYINRHLTEPLTLEQIAKNFYLNKDYLGRLFKEHTQSTIGHYIAIQRISLAQSMLSEGHTVNEVQEKLGFSSYAYFFKFFKKMTGISPSQYRKDWTS